VTLVTLACREKWVQQVPLGRQVHLEAVEILGPWVALVLLAQRDHRDSTAHREAQETQVRLELKAKWEPVVRRDSKAIQVTPGRVER